MTFSIGDIVCTINKLHYGVIAKVIEGEVYIHWFDGYRTWEYTGDISGIEAA